MSSQNMSDFQAELGSEYIEVDEEYDDTEYVCGCMKVVKKIRKKKILIVKNVKNDNLYSLQVYDEKDLVSGKARDYANLYVSGSSIKDVLQKFELEVKNHKDEEVRSLASTFKRRNYTLENNVTTVSIGIQAKKYTL